MYKSGVYVCMRGEQGQGCVEVWCVEEWCVYVFCGVVGQGVGLCQQQKWPSTSPLSVGPNILVTPQQEQGPQVVPCPWAPTSQLRQSRNRGLKQSHVHGPQHPSYAKVGIGASSSPMSMGPNILVTPKQEQGPQLVPCPWALTSQLRHSRNRGLKQSHVHGPQHPSYATVGIGASSSPLSVGPNILVTPKQEQGPQVVPCPWAPTSQLRHSRNRGLKQSHVHGPQHPSYATVGIGASSSPLSVGPNILVTPQQEQGPQVVPCPWALTSQLRQSRNRGPQVVPCPWALTSQLRQSRNRGLKQSLVPWALTSQLRQSRNRGLKQSHVHGPQHPSYAKVGIGASSSPLSMGPNILVTPKQEQGPQVVPCPWALTSQLRQSRNRGLKQSLVHGP